MPKLLAGDIGWLGAGWLFAWMLGALVRLAVRPASDRATSRCRSRPVHTATPTPIPTRPSLRSRLALASLPAVLLAQILAGAADVAHAAAATAAGTLAGAWLARRYGLPVGPRFVATAGCAFGAAAVAGGFAFDLLMPRQGVLERGALYVAVSLGAWVLAASASAWFVEFTRGAGRARRRPREMPFARASAAFDDRLAYGLALTLCVALACGFVAAETSAQFRLSALVAACGLMSALGVRMMTGARFAAPRRAFADAAPTVTVAARADAGFFASATLSKIPEASLVAACSGETFDAACLLAPDAAAGGRDGLHAGAPPPAMRRRRRGRYGHTAQQGSGRLH
jgi:hypothetical protein